jgi:hypothetical protein
VQPTTEAVDAAGAVDAENAPTAPWKSLRDSHKRPQPFFSLDRIENEMHLALAREEGIREY